MSDDILLQNIIKRLDALEEQVFKRKVDYSSIDGASGIFDGYKMTTPAGKTYEVPANYAAKSKLVYGDTLKLVEEGGKKLFKHISKVNRRKTSGILTKKEGDWHALTDSGSYRVSDVAAEFQHAQLNSKVTVLLPEDNLKAPFATIDEVEGFNQIKLEVENKEQKVEQPKSNLIFEKGDLF